jgi:hypothetical protein
MKKIGGLFVIVACLLSMMASGQEIHHMTFKGVPINGTLRELVPKMKQQGFTYVKVEQYGEHRTAQFTGEFYGVKNCKVFAVAPDAVSNCQMIMVLFPSTNNWSILEDRYTKLNKSLTGKYGEPYEVTEEFKGRTPIDDAAKMYALLNGLCDYTTVYGIMEPKGTITVRISPDDTYEKGCVMLIYADVANMFPGEESNDDDL